MYDYYCPKCKKYCDFREEIELLECGFGGEFQETHFTCNTAVIVIPKYGTKKLTEGALEQ